MSCWVSVLRAPRRASLTVLEDTPQSLASFLVVPNGTNNLSWGLKILAIFVCLIKISFLSLLSHLVSLKSRMSWELISGTKVVLLVLLTKHIGIKFAK